MGLRRTAVAPSGDAMPSFDVVSEVDRMEVKNAVDQAQSELSSRFDFKGVRATIETRRQNRLTAAGRG